MLSKVAVTALFVTLLLPACAPRPVPVTGRPSVETPVPAPTPTPTPRPVAPPPVFREVPEPRIDIGVAVDVTPCHDRPGDLEGSNALDHGVAIKISDTGSISDEGLVNKSIALCKEHNVPYQKDVIYVGGTDAGAMTLVGGGIKTIGFSVVTRYTHGPNAIVSQKDIEATVKMLELFMNADFE